MLRNVCRFELYGGVVSFFVGELDVLLGCYLWFYGFLSCSVKVYSSLEFFDLVLFFWDVVWICLCCIEWIVFFVMWIMMCLECEYMGGVVGFSFVWIVYRIVFVLLGWI